MIVYLNGQYIPRERASIDVDDRGFLFADGIYEVIHSYEGHLFQIDAHLQRMEHGLRSLYIAIDDVQAMRENEFGLVVVGQQADGRLIPCGAQGGEHDHYHQREPVPSFWWNHGT